MGKNRDRLSIIADVLEAAKSNASKTRIMLKANLSFSLLEKYLDVTLAAGFIRFEGSTYELTEDGHAFLKHYNGFHEHDAQAQKMLEDVSFEREKLLRLCEKVKLVEPDYECKKSKLGIA